MGKRLLQGEHTRKIYKPTPTARKGSLMMFAVKGKTRMVSFPFHHLFGTDTRCRDAAAASRGRRETFVSTACRARDKFIWRSSRCFGKRRRGTRSSGRMRKRFMEQCTQTLSARGTDVPAVFTGEKRCRRT